ncbi:MAG TPA: PAS domain S-box protein [Blastocatellia bacterium]|nr:PAS domain S-box protein [Blastocatellia bacterium]
MVEPHIDPASEESKCFWSRCAQVAAATAAMAGSLGLIGWIFDVGALKSICPNLATMKANTALAFVLQGTALWTLAAPRSGRRRRLIGQACAAISCVIGLLSLLEYIFRQDFGIDQILFKASQTAPGQPPGRMSPVTALEFVLLGLALTIQGARRWRAATDLFAIVAWQLSFLALLGYLYGVESLYSIIPYTSVALNTAVAFVTLSVGSLLINPDQGMAGVITRAGPGGALARRLLPASLIIPVLVGWLRLQGQRAGLYDATFGVAGFAAANVSVFAALVLWNARLVSRTDDSRRRAEEKLQRSREELELRVSGRTAELVEANRVLQQEVADRRRAEAALRKSEARFSGILEIADDAIISVDETQRITLFNQGAERIFGYKAEEVLGKPLDTLLPERLRSSHRRRVDDFAGSTDGTRRMAERAEVVGVRRNGEEFPAEASISKLDLGGDRVFTVMLRDVTDRKRSEEERQKLVSLVEHSTDFIGVASLEGQAIFVNRAGQQMVGLDREDHAEAAGILDFVAVEDRDRFQDYVLPVTLREGHWEGETRFRHFKTGLPIPMLQNIFLITEQSGDRPVAFATISRDITDRKHTEDAITESLKAKDLLLREIHHRVKNNLQVVSSLLSIQSNYSSDKHSQDILRDSQTRVHSMGLVHEQLYRSEDLAHIDFVQYVRRLTDDLLVSYAGQTRSIAVQIGADKVVVDIDSAIPLGLIITESVSNSLKHAFPGDRGGHIEVYLHKRPDDSLVLAIADNGIGLPEEFDMASSGSLGLRLIRELAVQLRGTSEIIRRAPGTEIRISFGFARHTKGV